MRDHSPHLVESAPIAQAPGSAPIGLSACCSNGDLTDPRMQLKQDHVVVPFALEPKKKGTNDDQSLLASNIRKELIRPSSWSLKANYVSATLTGASGAVGFVITILCWYFSKQHGGGAVPGRMGYLATSPISNRPAGEPGVRKTIMGLMLLPLVLGSIPSPASASESCIRSANGRTAAALAKIEQSDFNAGAKIQTEAATSLHSCLSENPSEATLEAKQRLGQLWMYAGEHWQAAGNSKLARVALLQARSLFLRLRTSGKLSGGILDEAIMDTHRTDRDLSGLQEVRPPPTERPPGRARRTRSFQFE